LELFKLSNVLLYLEILLAKRGLEVDLLLVRKGKNLLSMFVELRLSLDFKLSISSSTLLQGFIPLGGILFHLDNGRRLSHYCTP